tara:strand:+ start:53 stop:1012 length:960 start_codon:yes stop_codon:yes gene_type:complete
MIIMLKPSLSILLAGPRGFCAGVDRAILIVEECLRKYGAPVYVRHEIVHNPHVVQALREKGAVFVEDLSEVPSDSPVVFSAHGVPKSVAESAEIRGLSYIDATCPLVSKVHKEAEQHYKKSRQTLLIGHANHPEVIGTMGQVPEGSMILVESIAKAENVIVADEENVAFVTQTTLSVDDTKDIIDVLYKRFPHIVGPKKEDICYATTNRQKAVKSIAPKCDALIVIGASNSSNSQRLVEVGMKAGCAMSFLVEQAKDVPWGEILPGTTLGVTAGASAPELLVDEVLVEAKQRYDVTVSEIKVADENITFKLPSKLSVGL